tara:strand:+ start:3981 stop:4892 length:912 start_codon:yes stop_codon:yes gene_type:complete
MTETTGLAFSEKPLYEPERYSASLAENTLSMRNELYEKFKRHITLLLEQNKTRKVASRKGYLNPRSLHKYQYADNIFQKTIRSISADTTIVFLIDGSGSMSNTIDTSVGKLTYINVCTAVASAFAKANATVLKGKIPIEVFIKSAPTVHGTSLTGTKNGGMAVLSRVFTSSKRDNNYDRLLKVGTNSPIIFKSGSYDGSYTCEYAVLPALQKWIAKNVKTKKCIVFNLTDGEAYCSLGVTDYQFRSEDTKAMRMKYLRGIPNLTLMLGAEGDERKKDIYGENMLCAEEDFSGALFRAFAGFLS